MPLYKLLFTVNNIKIKQMPKWLADMAYYLKKTFLLASKILANFLMYNAL